MAKPITSHGPAFGSPALAASHAASRRRLGLRRARERGGEIDAVDIARA
jgi:hypothetical protein